MKISIITVTYNSGATVTDTLLSISEQTYENIEHIIIDGGSTDNTLDLVRQYGRHVKIIITEKDQGVYDAMNKGINLATGNIIGFLNSDDLYADNNVIELVVQKIGGKDIDACYGDLVYVKSKNTHNIVRYWKSGIFIKARLKNGWIPPHPTFFARREIYKKNGLFDLSYTLAADYEFMARFIGKYSIRLIYIPKVLVKMRLGGMTNRNLKNIFVQNKEIRAAAQANGILTSLPRLILYKLFRRGLEFFLRPS